MIARGDGVGFLDPHGDTAEELLDHILPNRTRDVCYFNPADVRFPLSWNPLASVPKDRQPLVIEDVVAACRNLFRAGWGYQTEYILRNCIASLIAAENTSLVCVRKLLIDPEYRRGILKQVTDPMVLSFWYDEFETWEAKFRRPAITPPLNKLGALFENPIARNILGQVQNRLDFRALIDNRAIFIAPLSKGIIGSHTASILGSLLMTHFHRAALQRANMPIKKRIPFHLFADEFQSFVTDDPEAFADTLAEARKYKLYLTLSHQFLAQIHDDELKHATLSNAGNLFIFRVSGHDAKFLEDTFSPNVTRKEFVNLHRGEVIAKLLHDGSPSVPFKGTVASALENRHDQRGKIVTQSRRRFAKERHVVEDRLTKVLKPTLSSETPAVVRRVRQ
jgi:hypothetical protein